MFVHSLKKSATRFLLIAALDVVTASAALLGQNLLYARDPTSDGKPDDSITLTIS